MKRAVFFVLFALLLTSARSQNLVVNPGLETWESSTKPSGWTSAQSCAMESSIVNSGSYSCLQTAGADSRDLNQSIDVQPGKDYSFSVYFQTSAATTGNGGRIWCKWMNAGVDVTDEASKAIMQTNYLKSTSWHQHSFTVKAPLTATTFLLQVRTLPNSVTYWDSFVFEEGIATGLNDDVRTSPEIYPVPATDYLNIKNASGIKSLELLDLSGTVLKALEPPVDSEISIYIGDLEKGFYILRMRIAGMVKVRKLLKD